MLHSNQTECVGDNATFTVSATGGTVTYQWQEDDGGGGGFANISNGASFSGIFPVSRYALFFFIFQNGFIVWDYFFSAVFMFYY